MSLAPDAVHRIQNRVGTTVRNKYRLDGLLGAGGMGAVYAATHRNGSRVALKVLHPELARLEDIRARFLREGYVANRIPHPGVTRVIDDDDDEAERTVFLVLELLEGETLQARTTRLGGRLTLAEALVNVDRLLDVLAAAHEQGVVHRDVKPDNAFLTVDGRFKILDFGIARLLDGTGATRSGQLLGTPAFMSPEQANGRVREIDGRSDVWSVGAVLFALLTGAEVHVGSTPSEQMIYAATQTARPIQSLAPWLAPDVAFVINRSLAFERDRRWPTARAMQLALRATSSFQAIRPSEVPQDVPSSRVAATLGMRGQGPTPSPNESLAIDLTRQQADRGRTRRG
jgi:eukaryotic-like serine/threonine-protein kinase